MGEFGAFGFRLFYSLTNVPRVQFSLSSSRSNYWPQTLRIRLPEFPNQTVFSSSRLSIDRSDRPSPIRFQATSFFIRNKSYQGRNRRIKKPADYWKGKHQPDDGRQLKTYVDTHENISIQGLPLARGNMVEVHHHPTAGNLTILRGRCIQPFLDVLQFSNGGRKRARIACFWVHAE